jgi:hypothetical protein
VLLLIYRGSVELLLHETTQEVCLTWTLGCRVASFFDQQGGVRQGHW